MANAKTMRMIRDILIVVTAVLMVLVVLFQFLEIRKFELMDVIQTRIKALFQSSSDGAPAAAPATAPEANAAADNAHGTSGIKAAVDAKKDAEAEVGL